MDIKEQIKEELLKELMEQIKGRLSINVDVVYDGGSDYVKVQLLLDYEEISSEVALLPSNN